MSQITSHVLDTSLGKPAEGMEIIFQEFTDEESWSQIATGTTDPDGRVSDFISDDHILKPGIYRLVFVTGEYFDQTERSSFYPVIPIVFEITDSSHYHVPLLLNPYGYSTYRGS